MVFDWTLSTLLHSLFLSPLPLQTPFVSNSSSHSPHYCLSKHRPYLSRWSSNTDKNSHDINLYQNYNDHYSNADNDIAAASAAHDDNHKKKKKKRKKEKKKEEENGRRRKRRREGKKKVKKNNNTKKKSMSYQNFNKKANEEEDEKGRATKKKDNFLSKTQHEQ